LRQAQGAGTSPGYRRTLLVLGGLFLAPLLLFGRAAEFPFLNYDDQLYVYTNTHVRGGLTRENAAWAFTTFETGNWHPLTWLSLQLDATLFGADRAAGFHLTNVLLHAANAVLLFLALRGMTDALWRSALSAALFALHPLRVESVAWVAERKDVLCALFWMLALCAYAGYARRPGLGRYALVLAALLLGLLAKPMLVTLPFVLLLLDYWPLRRTAPGGAPAGAPSAGGRPAARRLILEKVPLLIPVFAACGVALVAQARGEALITLEEVPLPDRVAGALVAYVAYLWQTVWPANLAPFYPHRHIGLLSPEAAGCAALLAFVTALCLRAARRLPYLPVGWLWYLGTLVPVIGLVQVGLQARADRYTYLPSVGLFLIVAWGGADLLGRLGVPARARGALAAAALLAGAGCTWAQLGYWSDNVTLWQHTLEATGPDNSVAQEGLGIALLDGKPPDPARALPHLRRGIELHPDDPPALLALGRALVELGQCGEALSPLSRVVARKPRDAMANYWYAAALTGVGRTDEALHAFTAAGPDDGGFQARLWLGQRLLVRQQAAAARQQFEAAVGINPASDQAHLYLGLSLAWEGRFDDAARSDREALRLNPSDPAAYGQLGTALLHLRQYGEAKRYLEQAVARAPSSAAFLGHLGLALSELHDPAAARARYEAALQLDRSWPGKAAGAAWDAATRPNTPPGLVADAVLLAREACEATGGRRPELLRVLAAAYAAAGRFPEAERTLQPVVEQAQNSAPRELVAELQRELRLYQSRKSLAGAPAAPRPG
jgi:tetratricopeptide (TPR) repeat protein